MYHTAYDLSMQNIFQVAIIIIMTSSILATYLLYERRVFIGLLPSSLCPEIQQLSYGLLSFSSKPVLLLASFPKLPVQGISSLSPLTGNA